MTAVAKKKTNQIISILMERDGMTLEEATSHYKYVKELIHEAISSGDYDEVEDIMASEFGLEMDYIFDIM